MYDLVLLDVMLPKVDGLSVCQRNRETSSVPIIMLTAKGEDMDKILGLEYGEDDYMTKHFNILEVKARIKSILRRAGANREAPKMELSANGLSINIGSRSATLDGKNVSLTMKEFDLLQLFGDRVQVDGFQLHRQIENRYIDDLVRLFVERFRCEQSLHLDDGILFEHKRTENGLFEFNCLRRNDAGWSGH